MKVIFLDIDGVICTEFNKRDEFGHLFNPECLLNLEYLISKSLAKIVISSTWRYSGLGTMKTMWEMRSLPGEVIDITPNLTYGEGFKTRTPRGAEIEQWLALNDIDSYVIIDDCDDMLADQQDRFILVTDGLTREKAEKAISILNN